jgi:hypothetical membrane protein
VNWLPKIKNAILLKISGICGILAPVFAFTFIFLAVASYPQFSWTSNALSDLGVVPGVTAGLFNSGLIVSGIWCFMFAIGLFMFLGESMLGRAGVFVLVLACLALVAIGIFPESVRPVHYFVSVAFFGLLPISMLIITGGFWLMGQLRMAVFTLLVAIAAAAPWVLYYSIRYVSGVAIPELVSAVAGSVWVVVLSSITISNTMEGNGKCMQIIAYCDRK